jgi:sarcosine oxidase subunit beta
MPLRLLRFGLTPAYPEPRMFHAADRLVPGYVAVIVGAGGHELAVAYYLARDHGLSDFAVLD